jgi:hypothetical protein
MSNWSFDLDREAYDWVGKKCNMYKNGRSKNGPDLSKERPLRRLK